MEALTESQDAMIRSAKNILADRMREPGENLAYDDDLFDWLRLHLTDKEHEVFWCLALDDQNRLLASEALFSGTLSKVDIHQREICKFLLANNASRAIFAHNHPILGHNLPSYGDWLQTNTLRVTLGLLEIDLVDHLIVCGMNVHRVSEFDRPRETKLAPSSPPHEERLRIVGRFLACALRHLREIDPNEREPTTLLVTAAYREATA